MFTSTPIDSLIHIHQWEQSSNTASVRHRIDIYKHGILRVSPTITINCSLINQLSMVFLEQSCILSHSQSPNVLHIFIAYRLLREKQPSKPQPIHENQLTKELKELQSPMKIYGIHGTIGWDEHAALAQKTLKANYWENHFTVTIGVALSIKRFKRDVWGSISHLAKYPNFHHQTLRRKIGAELLQVGVPSGISNVLLERTSTAILESIFQHFQEQLQQHRPPTQPPWQLWNLFASVGAKTSKPLHNYDQTKSRNIDGVINGCICASNDRDL